VSALDVSVQAQVLNLLQDLQDELGMSYLFIVHDLAVVKYMADEIMVMKEGGVVELAGSDDIHAGPKHPFTRQLLAAIPEVKGQVGSGALQLNQRLNWSFTVADRGAWAMPD
jgi:peptide/nickel transport system ATP-binding protein